MNDLLFNKKYQIFTISEASSFQMSHALTF